MGKDRELEGKRLDTFHSVFMKLLCILQRGQTYCAKFILFLCTRINRPDVDAWKKLKKLLCFMNQTIDNERIIRANYLQEMQTYVDFSRAFHMDIRVHTGGVRNFGIGVLRAKLSKQNINLRSSNKLEVIGNSECLP